MMELILEIFGELLLSSKKIKPWVKTSFVCGVLLVLAVLLCWGVYLELIHGGSVANTVSLAVILAVALAFGFWYAWKCHRNNWEKY